ncbi:MAG TPA: FHA domain-containing protein [Thermomicrobiales bacterium]|nr:FHA domain-containing protein [Thermomicrobiales bacterium]
METMGRRGQRDAPAGRPEGPGCLFVVSQDQKGRSYPLDAPRLTIGRGVSNDIVTADPRASRLHAEVRREGADVVLVDPGSTNGTFVNGQRVGRAVLRDGDLLQIGGFSLVYQADGVRQAGERTRAGADAASAERPTPHALVLPDIFNLRARPVLTVGRDPSNDVVLDHPQVSRHHARLELRPDGRLAVTDLNSTNGTFVDGRQLQGTAQIPASALLTFGPFQFVYEDGKLIRGSEDGTIRIDCLHVGKTVAQGRALLNDLTFSILPREFVAIVGGSGAGKSTLLDALSGVRPANAGAVYYNNADYYAQMEAYRSSIGYVPQDDIVPTELTVERALHYAARLRLPADMSPSEVKARIEEVLDDLGLAERRDMPIKHLSGGQRKRVSIGAELLSKPTLFFLDEPTSGLDPGLEGRMMALLRKLADQGRTVVLITHATQNVDMCDNILFLAPGGHLAYYGPPRDALAYFGAEKFADIYTAIDREPDPATWPRRFEATPDFERNVVARLSPTLLAAGDGRAGGAHAAARVAASARPPAARRVSSRHQFSILSQRYLETVLRDRRNLIILLLQAPLIALMIALVFRGQIFDMAPVTAGGSGDNVGAQKVVFLLAMVAVWFGTSNAAREIVKEAAIYARERHVNLKLGPYVASKLAVLTLLSCLQDLVLLIPLALTGATVAQLPLLYLALVAGSVAGIGMGLAISAQAPNPDRAASFVPLALIPQIIFTGVIVDVSGNTVGRLLSYLMVTKWTYRALGATMQIDRIPVPMQPLPGLPAALAPELTANNPHMFFDQARRLFYLLPEHKDEFTASPFTYLAILLGFIVASIVTIVIFQRRKDVVR